MSSLGLTSSKARTLTSAAILIAVLLPERSPVEVSDQHNEVLPNGMHALLVQVIESDLLQSTARSARTGETVEILAIIAKSEAEAWLAQFGEVQ